MFYTYALIDPRDGAVFYIGKGKGPRLHQHEQEAARGVHNRKCDRIREITGSGAKVTKVILANFTEEAEAYEDEARRIEQIGLENLTNVIPGGRGGYASVVRTTSQKARLSVLWQIAPKLAKFLRLAAGGQRVFLGPVDLTPIVGKMVVAMIDDLGMEAVIDALRPHGVSVSING